MRDVTPPNWNDEIQFQYPLNQDAIIIDAGMFEGRWSNKAFEKFHCKIIGLEPVKSFYENCIERFKDIDKVQIFNFGLGAVSEKAHIHVKGDGSSRFINDGSLELVEFRSLFDILQLLLIDSVDLLKINIEGSEYSVLENIMKDGIADRIKFFQIQFHEGPEYSIERITNIRQSLEKTHDCLWRWNPMVWESWGKKG